MLPITLSPFPMRPAFPASEYYGDSATTRRQQRASRLPTGRLAADREGRHRVASHVHCCPLRRDRRPAIPRWQRPDRTSQSWPGPPAAHFPETAREEGPSAPAHSSTTARPIHQVRQVADDSRGFNHWFSFLAPLRLRLRARAVWWYRPAPTLSGLLPTSPPTRRFGLPSASTSRCDNRRRASHPAWTSSASWRTGDLVDPHSAQPIERVDHRSGLVHDPRHDRSDRRPGDP